MGNATLTVEQGGIEEEGQSPEIINIGNEF